MLGKQTGSLGNFSFVISEEISPGWLNYVLTNLLCHWNWTAACLLLILQTMIDKNLKCLYGADRLNLYLYIVNWKDKRAIVF